MAQTDRLVAIDIARSVAMLLAWRHKGSRTSLDLPVIAALALRIATPLFIVLFGAMVTLVYAQAASEAVCLKPLSNAGLAPFNAAYLLAQHSGPGLYGCLQLCVFGLCLLMLDTSPFVGILKYYAIMFFLLPGIIELIRKTGTRVLLAAALAYHALYPLLKAIPTHLNSAIKRLAASCLPLLEPERRR